MTRRAPQRILLSFFCALALILIPLSYSTVWAQSTTPSTTQQDRIDRNDVNQNQSNQDLNQNQSTQPSTDVNSSTETNSSTDMRQKPSSPENDPNSQNQN